MNKVDRIQVLYISIEGDYLLTKEIGDTSNSVIKVFLTTSIHSSFKKTLSLLWENALINLIQVTIHDDIYEPELIVLNPNYLINISSLAECFKDYGCSPLNYVFSRFQPISNTQYTLLGNTANLFLDEIIYAEAQLSDYKQCIQKAFHQYQYDFSVCPDLTTREEDCKFFHSAQEHYKNIYNLINVFLNQSKTDSIILEPSFICEGLGIQGRLDLMLQDYSSFIELKSGRAEDDWKTNQYIKSKQSHYVQVLLYLATLKFNKSISQEIKAYLLYSRYPIFSFESYSLKSIQQIIDLRNQIVANDYYIQKQNSIQYTHHFLSEITADQLNQANRCDTIWNKYTRPNIESFSASLQQLSAIEQNYFMSIYTFITKEEYVNQVGDESSTINKGVTYLWDTTLEKKLAIGAIFYNLKIKENQAANEQHFISFFIPNYKEDYFPNFRTGDIVVLYERNTDADKATNKQVFKGSIEAIDSDSITIRLRVRQKNLSILPQNSLYAIEHDYMDTSYLSMYRSLFYFLQANQERRDLLLAQRTPLFSKEFDKKIVESQNDTEHAVWKACASKDYFLLVGPPGTGKTSRALKKMIEETLYHTNDNLLLLAYTNRAVDEICKTLHSIDEEITYIRIGNELTCEETYRSHLLEHCIQSIQSRKEVRQILKNHRIYIGTIASFASKMSLFSLKHFETAIIDEATQILEPHLLGLLSIKNPDGKNAIGRFILIGDQKQLPAVVLQNKTEAIIKDPLLNAIGLQNLCDSLFERLYSFNKRIVPNQQSYDMLHTQGRMHPEIAAFPNLYFYKNQLDIVPLVHQTEKLKYEFEISNRLDNYVGSYRLGFIPSQKSSHSFSLNTNETEAEIIASLAESVYHLHQQSKLPFDCNTLGIITPYRNQIALIRKVIQRKNIQELNTVTIDTVERFQGGQKDIILFSFCINDCSQIEEMTNEIEEEGTIIDRKLNVVLTRARKQLFITGVPYLLESNNNYNQLLQFIRKTGGYLNCTTQQFLEEDF